MTLDNEIRQQILDLVHQRPQAVAEIANAIQKNWRTADRYIEQLASEDLIKIHVFRKGGRGSLKIAYWPTSLNETPSAIKNQLLQKILTGVNKEDFSALDVVQNIEKENYKIIHLPKKEIEDKKNISNFFDHIDSAKETILFFTGNLSFTKMGNKYNKFLDLIDKKLKQNVNVYVLTRVDLSNKKIINDLLTLNKRHINAKIHIRYKRQPLRCTVIDGKEFSIKEVHTSEKGEVTNLVFRVSDNQWTQWIANVFWHVWRGSIDAEKRLEILSNIK